MNDRITQSRILVDYGWFLLSYHFWGSTAMVVCVFAHMSQVYLWGAYKSPAN